MNKTIETKSQMIMRIAELSEANAILENMVKECERLKEENKELKSSLVRQASTILTLEKSSNDLSQGTNKLYKALQEIREICKNSHTSASEDYYRTADKIQAKINEVIGAE